MIGSKSIASKLIKERCYRCDVKIEPYAETGVIGVAYRASLSTIAEYVNEIDDDPFMQFDIIIWTW